ncbi:MAG: transcription-repair coupling factor, partial [Erysipelotrichales bacterium]|nr:transcription-repair coupling factor [Erysipelotrichales bacterium]
IMEKLRRMGYRLTDHVEQPLTYAYRGEILDVFSVQNDHPLRVEFFDDEIDSLRYFDLDSQMTVEKAKSSVIIPASDRLFTAEEIEEIREKSQEKYRKDAEKLPAEDKAVLAENLRQDLEYLSESVRENYLYRYSAFLSKTYGLADYLDDPHIVISPVEQVKEHARSLTQDQIVYIQSLFEERKGLLKFDVYRDLYDAEKDRDVYDIHQFAPLKDWIRTEIRPLETPRIALSLTMKEIRRQAKDHTVILEIKGPNVKSLTDALLAEDLPYGIVTDTIPKESGVYVWIEEAAEGFVYEPEKLIVYTERELFGVKVKLGKYSDKFRHAQVLQDYDDLTPGDFVVHNQYGIGRYLGIVTKEFNGTHHDYLNIVYRGDDVLLVPLDQFKLVRKFIGSEGTVPRLSKLGTNEWKNTKKRLQENVEDIAEKLLRLYTAREQNIGFAFSKDTVMQEEFEEAFEYELTADQTKAVEDVKEDMESAKPMDRLICGDVGFGKTEVAMRAAYKAALDNKQTAVLCPTTILSRQHYLTFKKRFADHPVEIAVLNRFVEPAEVKRTLERIREGKVDIVVGTHRLLSNDVRFKDLGLLVVDEEQRFGVEAKEKIKELRQSVDVLSLSATPIPRTLQMSLIGVRSLSQLNTPPNDRMPVQTYVLEKNSGIVREVIERELGRQGQVFYLFNNVMRIYEEAQKIRRLVPEANVAVAHGQMSREEIEDVMMKFTDGEYNVLVCTTIVENGIDIPNANTMIVDNADRFGLAQLYQIKGRVGRSNRIAYAYLMIPPKKQLSETAAKRLDAIKDFTQLGSGYKIAMRDLAIRGAGDLLGAKQAGFINTVGMDLYVDMLQDAIAKKKGLDLSAKEEIVPRAKIGVDGYIPKEFARKDYEKIHLYQRIDEASKESVLKKLEEEVIDRYGKIPDAVGLLFEKRRMEILAANTHVEEIREQPTEVEIIFKKDWCDKVDGVKLFETVSKISLDLKMRYTRGSIILRLPKKNGWLSLANETLEKIKNL